jgi:uncharacterized protein with beta-barrel porin domain
MRCSSWFSRARDCRGAGRRSVTAVAIVLGLALAAVSTSAEAQRGPPPPPPLAPPPPVITPVVTPAPLPFPLPLDVNSEMSAGSAMANLGSNFLERLGQQASNGFGSGLRRNPGGGGASAATDAPTFRMWGELYGISATNGAQGNFDADRRQTWGGVAGFGGRIMPGVNVGVSVDQSHTAIDVPLALQSAGLDLTQFGVNASVDKGPWTWAIALVHGFGAINSVRDTGVGFAAAGYGARLDGGLTELSYYWSFDQSRIVPKADFEYVRSVTGSYQEMGGLDPVSASGSTLERSRILIGAEVGHYWIINQKILDLSAYGKFVDNLTQNFSSTIVSLGPQTITVQGIGESRYGADAGASASLSLNDTVRLYANYDGKFRAINQSHQGTLGVEVRW